MVNKNRAKIQYFSKWIFLSSLIGLIAALISTLFIRTLDYITDLRVIYPALIYLLPILGLIIGILYHFMGTEASKGNNLVLEEIHNPNKVLPYKFAPLVFIGTVLTHLGGGSAGREGAIVQTSAIFSDQLTRFFKLNGNDRKILLMAGVAAGFGSAIGAPIAGMIFGMEVIYIGKIRTHAWFQCLIASYFGYFTCLYFKTPLFHFTHINTPEFHLIHLFFLTLAGALFGLTALSFSKLTHFIEAIFKKYISPIYFIPFISGIILVLLFKIEGNLKYSGLGVELINSSMQKIALFSTPFFKLCFTSLTIGTGFKGGEFVPLVIIGTTLGSALSLVIPLTVTFLSSLGFVSVFAGAANTPLACSIMAAELFGWQLLPYALITCYISYYFSGHSGIYHSQIIHRHKYSFLQKIF